MTIVLLIYASSIISHYTHLYLQGKCVWDTLWNNIWESLGLEYPNRFRRFARAYAVFRELSAGPRPQNVANTVTLERSCSTIYWHVLVPACFSFISHDVSSATRGSTEVLSRSPPCDCQRLNILSWWPGGRTGDLNLELWVKLCHLWCDIYGITTDYIHTVLYIIYHHIPSYTYQHLSASLSALRWCFAGSTWRTWRPPPAPTPFAMAKRCSSLRGPKSCRCFFPSNEKWVRY